MFDLKVLLVYLTNTYIINKIYYMFMCNICIQIYIHVLRIHMCVHCITKIFMFGWELPNFIKCINMTICVLEMGWGSAC